MTTQYIGSPEYTAVAAWAAGTVYGAGAIVRQLAAPAVGSERCFRTTAGGTAAGSEPAWTLTHGGSTTDNTVTWVEVTGNATYNWSAPHARVANALATNWAAAGDILYVSEDHAATQSTAITWTFPGTAASPNILVCVNHAGSVPPVSADVRTTATETSTLTTSAATAFIGASYATIYGVNVTFGSGANAVNAAIPSTVANAKQKWWNSSFTFGATGAGSLFIGPNASSILAQRVELIGTPINFSGTGQSIGCSGAELRWADTAAAIGGAAVPTNLFTTSTHPYPNTYTLDGLDLSAMTGTLVPSLGFSATFEILNCRLNASTTVAATPGTPGSAKTYLVNSDSGATGYRQAVFDYAGTLTQEITNVRSGGATDGVTPISWKIVTNANANFNTAFEGFDIFIWAGSTGVSQTALIPVMSGATLLNTDMWVEAYYLGSASYPLASIVSQGPANPIATGSNLPTDAISSWTTSGVGSPVLQSLSVTFTVNTAGYVRLRVKVAKASLTVWVDPKVQGVT